MRKRHLNSIILGLVSACMLLPALSGTAAASSADAGLRDANGYYRQVILSDEADLFSAQDEYALLARGQALAELSGWDVRMVTTDDAGGRSAQEYLEDFYMDHYRQDDGVGFLIDMDNRELYISTSGEAIYYLTDDRLDRLLDAAFDYVSDQRYAHSMSAMVEGTITAFRQGIDTNTYTYNTDTGEIVYYEPPKQITAGEGLFAAFVGLLTSLGIGTSVTARYRMKHKQYQFNVKKNSKLKLSLSNDMLVNRYVTTRHIPKDPPPGSGMSSGGGGHQSTIHTGSGGHTFGGGGRKF